MRVFCWRTWAAPFQCLEDPWCCWIETPSFSLYLYAQDETVRGVKTSTLNTLPSCSSEKKLSLHILTRSNFLMAQVAAQHRLPMLACVQQYGSFIWLCNWVHSCLQTTFTLCSSPFSKMGRALGPPTAEPSRGSINRHIVWVEAVQHWQPTEPITKFVF